MGSVQKRGKGRYRARYWAADGSQRSKTFPTEKAARQFLALATVDTSRGEWVDPRLATTTVGEFADVWLERKSVTLKPSTYASYQGLLRTCVLPDWGRVPLGSVHHGDVASWVHRLSTRLSASRTRHSFVVLSQILDAAVRDGRLTRNPATSVGLPRLPPRREQRHLTIRQLTALADAAGDYRVMILTLGFTGLRLGEASAVKVSSIDFLRARLRISEALSEVAGTLVWGTPKGHAARSVPVPRFLRDLLAEHVGGKGPSDLVFTAPDGGPLRQQNWRRRVWDPATKQVGLVGAVPHDLRHTAVSLAIASGADIKAVQLLAGHRSATTTWDVYGHLYDQGLDSVADRLDAAFTQSFVASAWPDVASTVVPMHPPGQ